MTDEATVATEHKEEQSAPVDEAPQLLKGVAILPPRQKTDIDDPGLLLPALRADEPVQSLRGALSEVIGYAHLTNFRFELEERPIETNELKGRTKEPLKISPDQLVSKFTGKNAVIKVPLQVKNLETSLLKDDSIPPVVLDEFGDLSPLLDSKSTGIRIVLERYDAASVKDHVARLRTLLEGNAPTVTSLVDEKEVETTSDEEAEAAKEEEEKKEEKKPLPDLKRFEKSTVSPDGRNLKDFFYLSCGEDPNDFFTHAKKDEQTHKSKRKKKKGGSRDDLETTVTAEIPESRLVCENVPRWNQLEELVRVCCTIQYSGFHPPPPQRRLMGDIAYFEIKHRGVVLYITATTLGFYVNRTTDSCAFDPSPAPEPHFSHAMLDCILKASASFRETWSEALQAARERAEISTRLNQSTFGSLFHIATRGDFDGFKTAASALQASSQALDALLITPSWLVSLPRMFERDQNAWNHNRFHCYNRHRADEELQNAFGVDIRTGVIRDWNEELQLAREMPTNSLLERIERARLIHKVMTEFGEAALLGVKAISEGQIAPMNPTEATRSQVYLHNNIFFSRGVDAGPETFKIAKGDRAARKSSNRDVQCISTFHRMENSGLFTLATVLIDYIGTRFVCQSILPGILIGEKSHSLLYGAVETGVPLKWDKDLHKILEEKLGANMMVATRPVFKNPLTKERIEEIKELKKAAPHFLEIEKQYDDIQEKMDMNAVINTCVPVEAKGILGSDQRKYVLDLGRLTPRDANWVPVEKGGTGKFEESEKQNATKSSIAIPADLEDDEWVTCVLRPELVTRFAQISMSKYMQARKKKEEEKDAKNAGEETGSKDTSEKEKDARKETLEKVGSKDDKAEDPENGLSEEELEHLKSLRLNVNVFLPHMRSFEGINDEAAAQIKADEQLAREVAEFLWDDVLPKITRAVREGTVHQLPLDGRTLTEFLHRNGVNCRYLGRLAMLAKEQEAKDAKTESELKQGRLTMIERRTMPKCWLELVECEMVARAAKHVLDGYLSENGCIAASQPAQTIASFLSALVSESEETAAQTETRMEKSPQPDDDDLGALTIVDVGGEGDAVPLPIRSRHDVWKDIEAEVGRRFRYTLTLYNTGNKLGRALYTPLLRRVCQRTGVRLQAKEYDVGGRCFCSGGNVFGGQLTPSYPISPLDIIDIVPLMKHAAAYSEGFTPCTLGPSSVGLPSLQVSLQDARATLERAHIQTSSRALGKGLELAQEAASLYQRVTENAAHPGIIESLELMASIFLEAGDPALAAANGTKVLGLTVQNSGFDSAGAYNAHMSLFQILFAGREMDRAVKHLRAAMYLLEVMGGPRHTDHFSAYLKLGSTYSHSDYDGKYLASALEFYNEASGRESCDRLMEGIMARNFAKVLGGMEKYKDALGYEKRAFRTLSMFLGKDHHLTKESDLELKNFTKLAVEKGNRRLESEKMREEAARADSIAESLVAEETMQKKKNSKKKKRGKK